MDDITVVASVSYQERLAHAKALLSMAETSAQYRRGDQWATEAVMRVRAEVARLTEIVAGIKHLDRSSSSQ